jgi:hypothetical protein
MWNRIVFVFTLVAAIAVLPCKAQQARSPRHIASVARHVWHYADTHKEVLASDAVLFASWSAYSASTIYEENHCPTCIEANSIFGTRPSEHAVWRGAIGVASAESALNLLAWRHAPNRDVRHAIWMPTIPVAVTAAFVSHEKVLTGERDSPARATRLGISANSRFGRPWVFGSGSVTPTSVEH